MFALGGKRSDFSDGSFQRQEMLVADVMAEKARHGAETTRMLVWSVSRSVQRHFIAVEPNTCPGLSQTCAQIFFAGHEIKGASMSVIGEHKVHQRVFRSFLPGLGNLIDCFPFELL